MLPMRYVLDINMIEPSRLTHIHQNIAKAKKEIDVINGKSTTSSETAPEAVVDAIATPEAEKEEEEELPLPVPATTASEEVKETEQ